MPQQLLGQASYTGKANGIEDREGKRQCQAVSNSTYSAKDLVSSGTLSLPASWTWSTSVVIHMHLNIPTIMTSRSETKQESKQRTKVGSNLATQPVKCLVSNSLRAKASDKESPTKATPIITASPALLCMPTRLDGAGEQDKSLAPGHAAAWSSSFTGSLEGIASVKPPLGMQTTVQVLESKSSSQQRAPVQDLEEEPSKGNLNASDLVQETPNNRNEGAQTR